MTVTTCTICSRAMRYGGTLPLPICTRAGCEPEREHLRWAINYYKFEHWAIISNFQDRAPETCVRCGEEATQNVGGLAFCGQVCEDLYFRGLRQ